MNTYNFVELSYYLPKTQVNKLICLLDNKESIMQMFKHYEIYTRNDADKLKYYKNINSLVIHAENDTEYIRNVAMSSSIIDKIEYLIYHAPPFRGFINLGKFHNLKKLKCYGECCGIGKLMNLISVEIYENHMDNEFSNLVKLEKLHLETSARCTPYVFHNGNCDLEKLQNLKYICIKNINMMYKIDITKNVNLESIDIVDTNFICGNLGKLKNLRVSFPVWQSVMQNDFCDLEKLTLEYVDAKLDGLQKFTKLKQLEINCENIWTNMHIKIDVTNNTTLEQLTIYQSTNGYDKYICFAPFVIGIDTLNNLEKINLHNVIYNIDFNKLPKLKETKLNNCKFVNKIELHKM